MAACPSPASPPSPCSSPRSRSGPPATRNRHTRSASPRWTSQRPGRASRRCRAPEAQGWSAQGRSEVLARHGMVATSDPLAAQAGLEILRQGGNAIDAAVATGAVLDVTSQNDTGIGGDLFALVWVAKEKKLYALNAAGRCAGRLDAGVLHRQAGAEVGAEQRRQRRYRAGRHRRLRRVADAFRDPDLQGDLRARGADRGRGLGPC